MLEGQPRLALAVSGGGDSLALMWLARQWLDGLGKPPEVHVLTVDHGLHEKSAEVAARTCRQAGALGFACTVLRWEGKKPRTCIEERARQARYELMGAWCAENGAALVTAHTMDDQAETLLMRLARGSGLEGLAAMRPVARAPCARGAVMLFRPLLRVRRARLRATLKAAGLEWHEDPANEDERFERVRLRKLMPLLEEAGLSARAIGLSARRLGRANAAMCQYAHTFLRAHARLHDLGWAEASLPAFRELPAEVGIRALAWLLGHVGGQGERLRDLGGVEEVHDWVASSQGRARTLGGARLGRRARTLVITREPGRIREVTEVPKGAREAVWDERFIMAFEDLRADVRIMALNDLRVEDMPARERHVPADAWKAQPAIVHGDRLAGLPALGWRAQGAPFARARARLLFRLPEEP